jgi:hypothetical protein
MSAPEHQTEAVGIKKIGSPAPGIETGALSVAYAEVDAKQSPNMRQSTRWDYLTEYIAYWIDNKRYLAYFFVCLGVGIWALGVFAPVGLLLIMLSAKFKSMAWMDNFIVTKFGAHRSLVLID